MINIDSVIQGISIKINTFRDKLTTKIYMERVEQGFKEPCFFIKELRSNQTKEISNRYKRVHLYDIHYFPNPNSRTKNQDMRAMAELLYENMEYITVGSKPLMGLEMNHQIQDGVLHFFVRYPVHLFKEVEAIPKMESLDYGGGLKSE